MYKILFFALLLLLVNPFLGLSNSPTIQLLHYSAALDTKPGSSADSNALRQIYLKCRRLLLSDTAYATEQSFRVTDDIIYTTDAQGYLQSMNPAGFWSDLNYASQEKSAWPPSWHLYRLMLLCRGWHRTGQEAYLQAVHKGLDYWRQHDFQCDNWWHNQINTPYVYASLMIMLDKEATPAELAFLDTVLLKRVAQKNPTGQNKLWQHDIEARIALIHKDPSALQLAVEGMKSLVVVSTREGIQPDYSYHQHGAMLQFGNYGFHYVNSLLFWMTTTANTIFAFEPHQQQILFDYCSNGLRWTIFHRAMDLSAIGRQIRVNCDLKRGADLNNNFNLIKQAAPVDPCNFNLDGFENLSDNACKLTGNKGFWRSDYLVHRKNGDYMMSVKMHGIFVKKIESINAENLKGGFLSDGVTLIQHTGEEYRNIEPLWNWTQLPGTTCDTTRNPASAKVMSSSNISRFVGQLSDGKSGICAMVYQRDSLKAHKCWFFTGDLMVAMGSGIESPNRSNVVTTLDQWYHSQKVISSPSLSSGGYLWHDGVGYLIPDRQQAIYQKTGRSGNWTTVDKVSPSKMISDSVCTLFLSHRQNDSYAYIVNPDCTPDELKKMASRNEVKFLANTTALQAIRHKGIVMAVFYQAGQLKVPESASVEVSQPCILMIQTADSKEDIWVSDPTRKLESLQIRIGNKRFEATLPKGDYAGSSVKAIKIN